MLWIQISSKLWNKLNKRYKFTLDPCTTTDNPLHAPKFYTEKDNGLIQSWKDERVYCNPPYSDKTIKLWLEKAMTLEAEIVVLLLKSKTDTQAFHDYLYKKKGVRITFLKGRLKFEGRYGRKNSAPFASMIAVIKPEKKDRKIAKQGKGYFRNEYKKNLQQESKLMVGGIASEMNQKGRA